MGLDAEAGPFGAALGRVTDLVRITRAQPATAALRSVKAFWNVASEKGLRVGVVNWWASWPADPVNGWLVSDRAAFKLEKGGPADREVYPPEAFEGLRSLLDASEPERARRLDLFHLAAARRPLEVSPEAKLSRSAAAAWGATVGSGASASAAGAGGEGFVKVGRGVELGVGV